MRTVVSSWASFFALVFGGLTLWSAPFDDIALPKVEPQATEAPVPIVPAPKASISGTILESLKDEVPEDIGDLPVDEGPAPSSPSIAAVRAFQTGDIDGCLSHLRDVVAQRPTLPPPKLILAGFYLQAGERGAARSILEDLAAKNSKHPQLYVSLADLALAEGRLADAEAHLQLIEAQGLPSAWDDAEKQWLQASIISHQAAVAERRGNWERAAGLMGKWVQVAPQNPQLRHRWATALFNAEQFDEALEQLDIAYRQNPQLSPPEVALGVLYVGKGDYQDANLWYARAIKKYPEDPAIRSAWAMALLYQDRAAEAEEQLNQAAVHGGDSAHVEVLRGIAARAQGNFEAAEMHLAKVAAQMPGHEEARYHLIMSLTGQDSDAKRAKALEVAQQFVADMPDSSLAKTALGAVLHAQGKLEQAEELLQQAASQGFVRPETSYLYGVALADAGKKQEALKVAADLQKRIAESCIFVLRPDARLWVESMGP